MPLTSLFQNSKQDRAVRPSDKGPLPALDPDEEGEVEWGAFISKYGVSTLLAFVIDHKRSAAWRWSHPDSKAIKGMFKVHLPMYIRQCVAEARRQGVTISSVKLVLDGATCHHTSTVRSEVSRIGAQVELPITVQKLPARSPDLNPIEDVWHMLKAHIRLLHYSTLSMLRAAATASWKKLREEKLETMKDLAAGFSRRCQKVIRAGGAFTR